MDMAKDLLPFRVYSLVGYLFFKGSFAECKRHVGIDYWSGVNASLSLLTTAQDDGSKDDDQDDGFERKRSALN